MRNIFKKSFSDKLFNLVMQFENKSSLFLSNVVKSKVIRTWCSATRAYELRCESWNITIIGQIVPHPYEYIKLTTRDIVDRHIGSDVPFRLEHK